MDTRSPMPGKIFPGSRGQYSLVILILPRLWGILTLWLPLWLCGTFLAQDRISTSIVDQATVAFQQGKTDEAERVLRSALGDHPRDGGALGLLGVILDAQKRYKEAENCYTQALK